VHYTGRDNLGRITQKVETVEGTVTTYDYQYDLAGRLEYVFEDGVQVIHFVFDSNGNRLSHETPGGTVTGSYDSQDRMGSYGDATYAYTAAGELLSKTVGSDVTAYDYDVFGSLRSVTLPDGRVVEYEVDGQNRRVAKSVDGVVTQRYLYQDQLNPVATVDASGNVVQRFVYGTRINVPDYMVADGTTYRLISDHLGSVRLVVDATTGVVAQRLDYDEFGNVTSDTNAGFQPFGFAGGFYDADTGLVRFGARDHDPSTGRWTAKDPILFDGGQANLYVYAGNDPVNFVDPSGLTVSCTYSQSSGNLRCTDDGTGAQVVNDNGYAGHGPGLNNPNAQCQQNVGPLPRGNYTIGAGGNGPLGHPQLPLNPNPNNNMCGRNNFLIHADNSQQNQSASHGCIIVSQPSRQTIHNAGGGTLNVTQ
jgi:RHS repeat-associated protein